MRERIDSWCEWGIFGLTLAILVFGPLAFGGVRISESIWLYGALAAILLLWAVRSCVRDNYRLLIPPVAWSLLVLLGYIGWRTYTSTVQYTAQVEFFQIAALGIFFFAILDNLNRSESANRIVLTLIFTAMILAGYAVFQYLTDSQKILWVDKPMTYRGRGSGTYICPSHLGGFLVMILPLSLTYTLTGRLNNLLRVAIGYASLVILAGIAVTVSRGAWLAAAVSVFCLLLVLARRREFWIPVGICLSVMVLGGVLFGVKALQKRARTEAPTGTSLQLADRSDYWQPGLEIWRENYWIGGGTAHYDFLYHRHRPRSMQRRPAHAHNDYIEALADYGLLGGILIALFLAVLGCSVVRIWRFVKRGGDLASKPSNRSALVLGAAFGLLALAVHSAFDFNMHIPANAFLATTLVALVASHHRYATESYWFKTYWWSRILIAVGTLGLSWWIAGFALKLHTEAKLLLLADQFDPTSEERKNILLTATSVFPKNFDTLYTLAEIERKRAWEGNEGYQDQAGKALKTYWKVQALNPYVPYAYLGEGLTLGRLNQHGSAAAAFHRGFSLDPESYFVSAHMAWHYFQAGQYQKSYNWGLRSVARLNEGNTLGWAYVKASEKQLRAKGIDAASASQVIK